MDCMSARNSCWLGWVWVSRSEQTDPRKNSFPRPDFLYLFSGGPCQNNEYFFSLFGFYFRIRNERCNSPASYTLTQKKTWLLQVAAAVVVIRLSLRIIIRVKAKIIIKITWVIFLKKKIIYFSNYSKTQCNLGYFLYCLFFVHLLFSLQK